MKNSEILRRALDVIAEPEHWCQGVVALTAFDIPAHAHQADAVRFCAIGAVVRVETIVGRTLSTLPVINYLNRAARILMPSDESAQNTMDLDFVWFNNNRSHSDVVLMFKHAIALAEEDEG